MVEAREPFRCVVGEVLADGDDLRAPAERDAVAELPGADLTLERGEVLGLVGESGPAKSPTAPTVLGLLPGNAEVRG
ncbi:hypothetical protein [Streptomyces sp. TLI_185]|uniref:hypothetical protein n=1 Tax=Streptomyces sp. TLI_185 TaxID=2485151 RepID=UPI001C8514ED|nr:hypothetical protein [Streptomyces sp. TLI_185]